MAQRSRRIKLHVSDDSDDDDDDDDDEGGDVVAPPFAQRNASPTSDLSDTTDDDGGGKARPTHLGKRVRRKRDDSDSDDYDCKKRKRAAVRQRRGGRKEAANSSDEESSSHLEYQGTEEDDITCSSISVDSWGCKPNQLFCSWCDEPKHLDNFSAREKRNADNTNRRCLIHTAGPQNNYVGRLEYKAEVNLTGCDREGEAEEEDIHVDDTPKKGNLQYGFWYRGNAGGGMGDGGYSHENEGATHESPLEKMTKKYEDMIAHAQSNTDSSQREDSLKDTSSEESSDDDESSSERTMDDGDDEEEQEGKDDDNYDESYTDSHSSSESSEL